MKRQVNMSNNKLEFDPNAPFEVVDDSISEFDPNVPFEVVDNSLSTPIETPEISKLESGALGAAQGVTLGLADELSGAAAVITGEDSPLSLNPLDLSVPKAYISAVKNLGKDIYDVATTTDTIEDKIKERLKKYRETQQKTQKQIDAAREANPYTFGTAEVLSGLAIPGGAVVKGATKAAQLANLGKVGAATGAVAGLGYSEETIEEDPLALLMDIGTGAAVGGVLSPVAGSALKAVGRRTRAPVKEGESPQAVKNMLKDAAELYGVGGTLASGYETAKDLINDKDITQESLVGNLESGFTNPLAIAGSVLAPLAIKGGMAVKEAATDSTVLQNLYDSYLRGRTGEAITGEKAATKLTNKFNDAIENVTVKLKQLQNKIGSQKEKIIETGKPVDVTAELEAMREKVLKDPNLLADQKDELIQIIDNYNKGELKPTIKLVEDNKRQMKYLEQTKKNEQKIAKAQEQVQKDILDAEKKAVEAEQKAAKDLKKKLNEQKVRDELLGREAKLETIVPSNEDLLALRTIGEEGTPQIIKGRGAEIPKIPTEAELSASIPESLPEASFIKPTTIMERPGSTPLNAKKLSEFKNTILDLQKKLPNDPISREDLNSLIKKSLDPSGKIEFDEFNKSYSKLKDVYSGMGVDDAYSIKTDDNLSKAQALDAVKRFLFEVTGGVKPRPGETSTSSEIAKDNFVRAMNWLKEVDPKLADEITPEIIELMGSRNAMVRAGQDINTSNPTTGIFGSVGAMSNYLANALGKGAKVIKNETQSLIPESKLSKRLALKETTVQENIRRQLLTRNTPDGIKLADDITKIIEMPEGAAKNAKLFKLMQNPMYRQLFNEEKENIDKND
jgi:hypothetical protein